MPDADNLAHLPMLSPVKADQHIWNPPVTMAGKDFPDGCERSLRACALCGCVKVTVHGESCAWREWRTKDGKVWVGQLTPPCLSEPST